MHCVKSLLRASPESLQLLLTQTFRNRIKTERCTLSRFMHEALLPEIESELENEEYRDISKEYLSSAVGGRRTFILQPFVKWGETKKRNTTPQLQLEEAEALIKSLPNWSVVEKMCVPLLSLEKNKLLGRGNFDKLKTMFHSNRNINTLFVSKNMLRPVQVTELQDALGVPVFDRYAIVIQIFREHARTPEAKLQVALAEIPYVWKKVHWTAEDSGGRINLAESRKKVLAARETKLRNALKKLKEHRQLMRQNRVTRRIPSVAVVGYTNAGKTSLIKALTGDETLEPKDRLFATLDTTAHEGVLPSRLKVLYMDTIGFIQDVPEALIEPFVATFEDAIISDVIVHVFDASHPDRQAQIEHVQATLESLMTEDRPIINVANKCDRAEKGSVPESVIPVSSINSTGIDILRAEVEKAILSATGRTSTRIRVLSGSTAAAWLYKETAVTNVEPDPSNPQYLLMDVIATEAHLHKFRKFIRQ